jgi:hypothetical protein
MKVALSGRISGWQWLNLLNQHLCLCAHPSDAEGEAGVEAFFTEL